jgi:hypothetical protein
MDANDKHAVLEILSAASIPLTELRSTTATDANGRVVKLHLKSYFQLKALSPDIGRLRRLREVNISWCRNLKSLPKEIGELSELEALNIGWCDNLTSIPQEIRKLTGLQKLLLNGCNKLTTLPRDIWELPNLEFLCIHNCKNAKALELLEEGTKQNNSIVSLELSDNNLDHNDLAKLWDLLPKFPNLTNLNLECNAITTLVFKGSDAVQKPSRLRKLSLTANPIVENAHEGDRVSLSRILNANRELGFFGLEASNFQTSRLYSPCIRHLMDINESGRALFYDEAIPLSVWPVVFERADKTFKNSPSRRADAVFHLLHGPAFASRGNFPICTKRKADEAGIGLPE